MTRLLPLAAALTLALPAAAEARSGWFGPVTVAEEKARLSQIALGPTGEAFVTWAGDIDSPLPVSVATRPAGGRFGAPERVGGSSVYATIALGARGHATLGWRAPPPRHEFLTTGRAPAGPFGPPVTVEALGATDTEHPGDAATAVDALGTTTYAWRVTLIHDNGSRREDRIRVVRRAADGGFSPVQEIGSWRNIGHPALIVDRAGIALLAWQAVDHGEDPRASRVTYATAPPGQEFGAPRVLSGPAGPGITPRLASNGRGDAMLAWVPAPSGFSGSRAPGEKVPLFSSFRPSGGDFGPVESTLPEKVGPHPEAMDPQPGGQLALDDAGNAIFAWSNASNVLTTFKPAGREWGPITPITKMPVCCPTPAPDPFPSERLRALEFDAKGNAVLVLTDEARRLGFEERGAQGVGASVRPRGGRFGKPEGIAAQDAERGYCCSAALDRLGNGLVSWTDGRRVLAMLYDVAAPRIGYLDPVTTATRAAARAKPLTRGFRFRVSEPARVKLAIDRRGSGGWRRVGAVSLLAPKGPGRLALTKGLQARVAARGSYRATLSARDAAGRRAKPRTAEFAR
jgi:hypothetical protein